VPKEEEEEEAAEGEEEEEAASDPLFYPLRAIRAYDEIQNRCNKTRAS
jgi:hypothetical protein